MDLRQGPAPGPPLAPLEAEELPSLADRAHARLREAIVEGLLAPGAKLSERRLAGALGVSAQPVRAALARLEAEGMVESRPRSGTFVANLDAARLAEMGRIRAALEAVAAALAARRAGPAEIAALRARLAAIEAITPHGDPAADTAALARANEAFHDTLHAITGNAFLIRSLQALNAYSYMGRPRILSRSDEPRLAQAEHAAILEAVAAGDAETAEARMRAHALRSLSLAYPEVLQG